MDVILALGKTHLDYDDLLRHESNAQFIQVGLYLDLVTYMDIYRNLFGYKSKHLCGYLLTDLDTYLDTCLHTYFLPAWILSSIFTWRNILKFTHLNTYLRCLLGYLLGYLLRHLLGYKLGYLLDIYLDTNLDT